MDERVTKTKVAERLLMRPGGATMREILAATGGPQYNELKRLAGRGYAIRKVKEGSETRYFVVPPISPSFEATVTDKGQVTIPREVREHLQLHSGQKLRFVVKEGKEAVLMPVANRLSDLAGMLGKPRRSATLEEMDEAIGRAIVDRYLRAVGKKQ
jgi:antitoxin PrlF